MSLGIHHQNICAKLVATCMRKQSLQASKHPIASAGIAEAFTLSSLGVSLGIVLGLVQGWILIFVVNKQAFGWTLALSIPWDSLIVLGLVTLLSGALVSWRIGWWSSGLPVQQEE